MEKLYAACRALYENAFGCEPRDWNDALFRLAFPRYLRVIKEGDKPVSMLFSIPYPVQMGDMLLPARYMYAVATDPAYRGRGLATHLIGEEIARGEPVFLRPSSESLFGFYEKAGLAPLSPVRTLEGEAAIDACEGLRHLSPAEYLAARERFLKPPFAVPNEDFLALGFLYGGALALEGEFAALWERHGEKIYFKEWLGNRDFAPRAAAFLGGKHYRLRTPCEGGEPFGVGANLPRELAFLIALD